MQELVDDVNRDRVRVEQIKRFAILPRDFSQEEGEVTPTLKLRRRVVHEHFAEEIERLYSDAGLAGPPLGTTAGQPPQRPEANAAAGALAAGRIQRTGMAKPPPAALAEPRRPASDKRTPALPAFRSAEHNPSHRGNREAVYPVMRRAPS